MKQTIAMAFFLVALTFYTSFVSAEEPVYFADANLKAAVEEELSITDPNATDMLSLTSLTASNRGIVDPNGIQYATNLTRMELWGNQISNISLLSELTNLTILNLYANQISDITPLSELTSLTNLFIGSNQISDISVLSELTSLSGLFMHSNQISDISPISELANLSALTVNDNQISDISPLLTLTNLNSLYLSDNPLNALSYCAYMPLVEVNNPGISIIADANPLAGDCDGDCRVEPSDLFLIASRWLEFGCGDCGGADRTNDAGVSIEDIAVLSENWLSRIHWQVSEMTLDTDPDLATEGQWQFGHPDGGGGIVYGYPDPNSGVGYGYPDPNNGFTGTNVYGVNLSGDYDTIVGGPYYLTAGPFDCTYLDNVGLKFARWLNTDESGYVRSTVEVSIDGSIWNIAWQNDSRTSIADDNWQIVEYDLSSIADRQETVYVRWGYEVLEFAYPYSGWNIDDIELWGNT